MKSPKDNKDWVFILRLLFFALVSLSLLGALFVFGYIWAFRPEAVTEYPAIKVQIPGMLIMLFAGSGFILVGNILWQKIKEIKKS